VFQHDGLDGPDIIRAAPFYTQVFGVRPIFFLKKRSEIFVEEKHEERK
jgi:hypothetical protein